MVRSACSDGQKKHRTNDKATYLGLALGTGIMEGCAAKFDAEVQRGTSSNQKMDHAHVTLHSFSTRRERIRSNGLQMRVTYQ